MINSHRAARLDLIEEVLDDILDYAPTITDDADIRALLDQYETELIQHGHL